MITSPLQPGQVLDGKYRIEQVLGQGGMGVVVAATHLELDERVAIKFLLGIPSEVGAKRFLSEARSAAKVKNDHVCRVFDFGRTRSGEPYIVMEYLEGRDLADELAERGPLAPADVVRWAREACDGLGVAHALGIVHRDIKPENLFLATQPGGRQKVKVLDFGVSKSPESSVTQSATAMGSPLYMSPEQLMSSRDVDARADVWSMGATLYELLSGEPPFHAENVFALAAMIREDEAPPLALARPDLAPALCDVVMRCLSKQPEARFANAQELDHALAQVSVGVADTSGVAVPGRVVALSDTLVAPARTLAAETSSSPRGLPGQRVRAVVVGALAALAVVLVAAFGVSRGRGPQVPDASAASVPVPQVAPTESALATASAGLGPLPAVPAAATAAPSENAPTASPVAATQPTHKPKPKPSAAPPPSTKPPGKPPSAPSVAVPSRL